MRAILKDKDQWIRAMSLDPDTGLDPPGVKVRAAQGFDAAAYFITGYFIVSAFSPLLLVNAANLMFLYNSGLVCLILSQNSECCAHIRLLQRLSRTWQL